MTYRIFLDLDGVIADFDRHATEHGKFDANGKPKWEELDLGWWASIPPFAGARRFYYDLCALAPVKFLTAPTMNEACFAGKAKWVQKFLPEKGKRSLMDLIICPARDKALLARPTFILIDDREKNIREWEEAGGIGVLHTGDFRVTLRKVQAIIGNSPARVLKLSR